MQASTSTTTSQQVEFLVVSEACSLEASHRRRASSIEELTESFSQLNQQLQHAQLKENAMLHRLDNLQRLIGGQENPRFSLRFVDLKLMHTHTHSHTHTHAHTHSLLSSLSVRSPLFSLCLLLYVFILFSLFSPLFLALPPFLCLCPSLHSCACSHSIWHACMRG